MTETDVRYFSVVEVDKETLSPLYHKLGHMRTQNQRNRLIQNTLFLLVCITLCGLAVEGYFIYNLYRKNPESHSDLPLNEPQQDAPGEKKTVPLINPSRPLAHLTALIKWPDKNGLMQWDNTTDVIHQLKYEKGKLLVEKEGYYYVYSKIWFKSDGNFIHSVQKETPRYRNKPIDLLTDHRYQLKPAIKGSLRSSYLGGTEVISALIKSLMVCGNALKHPNPNPKIPTIKGSLRSSYLGGVFNLFKNDQVFVQVRNVSLIFISLEKLLRLGFEVVHQVTQLPKTIKIIFCGRIYNMEGCHQFLEMVTGHE
ncbi:tumor necrosis factor ligand superfamily member 14-like [Trichomycterus rosablanca]|uniref:tumor necrosis factor ligand superfamily member 14-like n=1 Tax=Trichomycterus rosablanca TaxID=2290929 RepID=UPI002F356313